MPTRRSLVVVAAGVLVLVGLAVALWMRSRSADFAPPAADVSRAPTPDVEDSHAAQPAPPPKIEDVLDRTPRSLEPCASEQWPAYEGYQCIVDIPRNLEKLYGVGCVLGAPNSASDLLEPFPSRELDYVPLGVTERMTLREFLDLTCADGKCGWGIVQDAIHIWPIARPYESGFLDTPGVSLDLQDACLLDAMKAWTAAVNRNRLADRKHVMVRHPSTGAQTLFKNRATAASLTRPGAVTLKLENVTALEALCAIQSASKEWVRINYQQVPVVPEIPDTVIVLPPEAEIEALPTITAEERRQLDATEGLDPGPAMADAEDGDLQ